MSESVLTVRLQQNLLYTFDEAPRSSVWEIIVGMSQRTTATQKANDIHRTI